MTNVLTVQTRGLGDAVIGATAVAWANEAQPESRFVIAGKRDNLRVMRALGVKADWVEMPFPASTGRELGCTAIWKMVRKALELRRRNIDIAINPFPDIREDFFFYLAGAKRTHRAYYGADSDATLKYRDYRLLRVGVQVDLSDESRGVYWQQARLFKTAIGVSIPNAVVPKVGKSHGAAQIGIHPFAGHPSREWPLLRWGELIDQIVYKGKRVVCFCPKGSGAKLAEVGIRKTAEIQIAEGDIEDFCNGIRGVGLLVCHDSFSAHLAAFYGIPRVVINGSGDPKVWLAADDYLSAGSQCAHYPCHGRPVCKGTAAEYICVHGVSVCDVVDKITSTLGEPLT